jgi:hypothetical protein
MACWPAAASIGGVDRESRPRLLCGADEARQATQADGEKCFHQPLFYPGSRLARASLMVARGLTFSNAPDAV